MHLKYLVISLFLFSHSAYAKTTIVKDFGNNTVLITEYYQKSEVALREPYTKEDVIRDINAQFPMNSTLRLGKLLKKSIGERLPANIALVGTDKLSRKWILQNKENFARYSPVIIVIDCPNLTEYTRFEKWMSELKLRVTRSSSVPFESIVDAYPVLIAGTELIQ